MKLPEYCIVIAHHRFLTSHFLQNTITMATLEGISLSSGIALMQKTCILSSCPGMNVTALEKAFCPWFSRLFACKSECMSWPVVLECCFTAEPTFPFVPGLCSAHRDFQLLLLSPIYVNGHVLQLSLYTIPFNCSFVSRSLGFLKAWPSVFSGLIAILMFSLFKICLICPDTPLIYGIDAYA